MSFNVFHGLCHHTQIVIRFAKEVNYKSCIKNVFHRIVWSQNYVTRSRSFGTTELLRSRIYFWQILETSSKTIWQLNILKNEYSSLENGLRLCWGIGASYEVRETLGAVLRSSRLRGYASQFVSILELWNQTNHEQFSQTWANDHLRMATTWP